MCVIETYIYRAIEPFKSETTKVEVFDREEKTYFCLFYRPKTDRLGGTVSTRRSLAR